MTQEKLRAEFEPLPGMSDRDASALLIRRHPSSSAVALKLAGSPWRLAVWDGASGELLWVPGERAGDLGWGPDGTEAYVVFNQFGPGPGGRGIGHRLRRYAWPARTPLEELFFGVPSAGADQLIVSPAGGLAAVIAIEGPEWYYEVLRLRPTLSQPHLGHMVREWLADGLAFAPDERFAVAVGGPGDRWWWRPEPGERDDWDEEREPPSGGGTFDVGAVYAHDLAEGRVTRHRLIAELPAGWQPRARPDDRVGWGWRSVWGPEFRGDRQFRLWLPDGSPLDLELPLAETVAVGPISPTWVGRRG